MRKTVFDCNIFAQALMNPFGPAGACVELALQGRVILYLADFILAEVRDLPTKPTPARVGVTPEKVESLVARLLLKAEIISDIPPVFAHPIDPDNSDYVNLALATGAELIVSRDRHLLGLNDQAKRWSAEFRARFPDLRVIAPEQLIADLRKDDLNT